MQTKIRILILFLIGQRLHAKEDIKITKFAPGKRFAT